MTAPLLSPNDPIKNLELGTIIEVDGTHIIAELDTRITELSRVYGGHIYPVGQFGSIIKIHYGRRLIYGYVSRLRMKSEFERERGIVVDSGSTARIIEADLFGEGEWISTTHDNTSSWSLQFSRGVSTFPLPQQHLYLTPHSELGFIYGHSDDPSITLGTHVGSGGAVCHANLNELLGKHTAVLGSTGSGKSGTVTAILHAILERAAIANHDKWNPRIIILDPHNEYASAFKASKLLSTDDSTLVLPYWLLNFQETVSLLIGKTEFVATSQANILKESLHSARIAACAALRIETNSVTVDSPIPYSLQALRKNVEILRDRNTQAAQKVPYNSILEKLDILCRDKRMAFMMNEWDANTDPFGMIVGQLVGDGEPIRIIDFSGVPNEVAGTASAVIARTLFSVKVWQTSAERKLSPLLLVCEEAHRYVPNSGEAQYESAQDAIRRLAKEGRKYGLGLMLVSQRPSEVEATVLSQCNSWVVLRITNDKDREHVRSVLPDSLSGLTKVLSGLGQREAIFVGLAATLPSRILIRHLEKNQLPDSHDIDFDKGWANDALSDDSLKEIAHRWRTQTKNSESIPQ